MFEARGVFKYVLCFLIDVDCFVVNLMHQCMFDLQMVGFLSLEVLRPKDHFWDWTSSWSQEQKS